MRYILLACIFSLGLAACGSNAPFNVGGDPSPGDSASAADAGSGREDVAAPVSGTSCLNRCNDYNAKATCQCDDKCVANGDCCGDFIKQCLVEVKPTQDAGSTSPDVAQPSCVDGDGDGFCSTAPKAGDCNDNDNKINPNATEACAPDGVGNGVDENCNGTKDEGCKAAPSNPAPTGNNTLTVKYSDSASRRLSYGVTSDVSSIPYVWTTGSWQTSDTFTADLGNLQVPSSKCLYVRFNVDEPNGKWLCMANQLNAAATSTLSAFGKTYGTTSVQKISLGGGCSGIYAVAFDGATCTVP